MYQATISGIGSFLPEKVVTNDFYFSESLGIKPSWFEEMGICERRHASKGETLVDLAVKAIENALKVAKLHGNDIELLIWTTSTLENNQLVPSEVTEVKARIGMKNGFCFHQIDGCAGILAALETASAYVMSGLVRHAVVATSDIFSKIANPNIELTYKMSASASDSASAVVISRAGQNDGKKIGSYINSSNEFKLGVAIKATGIRVKGEDLSGVFSDYVNHSSKMGFIDTSLTLLKLMRFTSKAVPDAVHAVLKKMAISKEDVDFFIFHQPNRPFLEKWKAKIGVIPSKTLDTLSQFGNCSASSVLINLDTAYKKGLLKHGAIICLSTVGEGVTYGASLWQWGL